MREILIWDEEAGRTRPKGDVLADRARRDGEKRVEMGLDFSPSAPELHRRCLVKPERRIVAETLPRNWSRAPMHDEHGRCCFQSKREIDEAVAASSWEDEHPVVWDD